MSRKVIDVFNAYAEYYDSWYNQLLGKYIISVETMALLKLLPHKGLGLEIGCGTGVFSIEVYRRIKNFEDVLCFDPAYNMLKKAKSRGLSCIGGIIEKLPFKKRVFDFIFMITVLEFLENPLKGLFSVRSILKKNGYFIVMFLNKNSSWGRYYRELAKKGEPILSLAKIYDFNSIERMLKESGFSIDKVLGVLDFSPLESPPSKIYVVKDNYMECGAIFIRAKVTSTE